MRLIQVVVVAMIASAVGCNAPDARQTVIAVLEEAGSPSLTERRLPFSPSDEKTRQGVRSLRTQYDDPNADVTERTRVRDRIMSAGLVAILHYHEATCDDVYHTTSTVETLFDFTSLGLTAAIPLTGSEGTKTALGAIATAVIGGRKALEANILADQAKFAILVNMQALRMTHLAKLLNKMQSTDDDEYSLDQGLIDLYDFFVQGSMRAALTDLTNKAQVNYNQGEAALEKVRNADLNDAEG